MGKITIILSLILAFFSKPAIAQDTVILWNGACYDTQVSATGMVTMTKTFNTVNGNYDIELAGDLSISSPVYGYIRHELPPGFLPNTDDQDQYLCDIAMRNGAVRAVRAARGTGAVDKDYENGALWFPETFSDGKYDLLCRWRTEQPNPVSGVWENCNGITGVILPPPTPTPTATFVPTAPPATPAPTATPLPPKTYYLYMMFVQLTTCLPIC